MIPCWYPLGITWKEMKTKNFSQGASSQVTPHPSGDTLHVKNSEKFPICMWRDLLYPWLCLLPKKRDLRLKMGGKLCLLIGERYLPPLRHSCNNPLLSNGQSPRVKDWICHFKTVQSVWNTSIHHRTQFLLTFIYCNSWFSPRCLCLFFLELQFAFCSCGLKRSSCSLTFKHHFLFSMQKKKSDTMIAFAIGFCSVS